MLGRACRPLPLQVVAQLGEREQLRVLTHFYERLFIPPRCPPWQPSAALLSALLAQRRDAQLPPGAAAGPAVGAGAAGHGGAEGRQQQQSVECQAQQQPQMPPPSTPRFQPQHKLPPAPLLAPPLGAGGSSLGRASLSSLSGLLRPASGAGAPLQPGGGATQPGLRPEDFGKLHVSLSGCFYYPTTAANTPLADAPTIASGHGMQLPAFACIWAQAGQATAPPQLTRGPLALCVSAGAGRDVLGPSCCRRPLRCLPQEQAQPGGLGRC